MKNKLDIYKCLNDDRFSMPKMLSFEECRKYVKRAKQEEREKILELCYCSHCKRMIKPKRDNEQVT